MLSSPGFVRLMKEYEIKPKDLGIKPRYKLMLKRSERKPSVDLVERLYALIKEKSKNEDNIIKTTGEEGARRLAWLGRRPYEAEVRGSSPRGPTKYHSIAYFVTKVFIQSELKDHVNVFNFVKHS